MREMKKVALVLLGLLLLTAYPSTAQAQQKAKITLSLKGEPLANALKEVQKQSGWKILYVVNDMKGYSVNANINGLTPPQAVAKILEGTPFTFTVKGKYISIAHKAAAAPEKPAATAADQHGAETIRVGGNVSDENGEPLIGVTIRVKGSSAATVTDTEGRFILNNVPEDAQIEFSHIGMNTLTRKALKHMNVHMTGDAKVLEDVVVTGYQQISQRELASAISSVKAEDIMVEGAASIDQMLQGRLPGVAVMNTSGEASATPKIRIRGNATINGNKSPVWVVDGVILEQDVPFTASDINSEDAEYLIGNAISGLNPQDIETITVLKDASATAIYGVKAANGVIVITTKKGRIGRPIITYNGDMTLNSRPSYSNYNMMDSQERVAFSKMLVDQGVTSGRTPVGETYEGAYEALLAKQITQQEFADRVNAMQTRNTNWFKELFHNNLTHTHTATISGGTSRMKYYMSTGFSNVQASAKGSESRRFNALAKMDAQINDIISLQAKINYSTTRNNGYHSSVNPFNYAYNTSRTLPIYNDDGSYYKIYRAVGTSSVQTVGYNVIEELDHTGQQSHMDNFDALLSLTAHIFDGLSYRGTFSWSQANTNTRNWAEDKSYYIGSNYRRYDYGAYTPYDTEYYESTLPYGGILTQGSIRRTSYTLRNQLEYRQNFGLHSVNAIAGTETRRNAYKGFTSTGYGWTPEYGEVFNPVLTDRFKSSILETGLTEPTNTNTFTQVASFYGILSYGFAERYIFNFNIRSDGSNKFGSNPKYRWLPTFSFAGRWNISNEAFLKEVKWIDNLALRASYGLQGNINEDSSPNLVLRVGDRDQQTSLPTSKFYLYPNPDLRWEKTHSWDAALDFSFLDGRIRGSFDVYGKKTKDLIILKTIAASNGTTSMYYNAGKMNNKGFEGFVNVGILKNKDWEWRAGVNFSRNVNEIIYANNDDLSSSEVQQQMLAGNMSVEGAPIGSLYAYHFAGIEPTTGQPLFYTKDGGKAIQGTRLGFELVRVGSIFPKLTGGFDTQLKYKEWSLGVNFTYQFGAVDRLPNYYANGQYTADPLNNVSREWLDCWRSGHTNTQYPGVFDYMTVSNFLASDTGKQYDAEDETLGGGMVYSYDMYNMSDVRVAKTDFLKLKLISLSYSFPKKLIAPLHVSNLRLRLQATNLFTICKSAWHGLDPESAGVGIPQLPSYSLSVNVSF